MTRRYVLYKLGFIYYLEFKKLKKANPLKDGDAKPQV